MKNPRKHDEGAVRLEEAQASIRTGIARARKLAAESKRLLDRLRYARLGPPTTSPLLDLPRSRRD
jgi:hypothetical protein